MPVKSLLISILASLSVSHASFSEESGLERTSISIQGFSYGQNSGTTAEMYVPPGSEIVNIELIDFVITAYPDPTCGWLGDDSELGHAHLEFIYNPSAPAGNCTGLTCVPFPGNQTTGTAGLDSWNFAMGPESDAGGCFQERQFCPDGVIQLRFYDTSPSCNPNVNCRWYRSGFENFEIEITYRSSTGACCLDEQSCMDLLEEECEAKGGVFLGSFTNCSDGGCDCTDPCGQPNCENYDPCDESCEQFEPCLCDPQDSRCEDCEYSSVHCVPGEFATIQDAIDFASDGDVILIGEGDYDGFNLEKNVVVRGSKSGKTRPLINSCFCLKLSNGGTLESLDIFFCPSVTCSPSGYSFTDRGIVNERSGTSGTVRDCVLINGCGNTWGGTLEFISCEFNGIFETAAFHLRNGAIAVRESLICGETGQLAYAFTGCVNFYDCDLSTTNDNYGDACFSNSNFFEECPIDSDGDGIPDSLDLCPGEDDTVDTDQDATPDGCDECPLDSNKTVPGKCGCGVSDEDADGDGVTDCLECVGDITGDNVVSGGDLAFILAAWSEADLYPSADLNEDGMVDGMDIGILLSRWGPCF